MNRWAFTITTLRGLPLPTLPRVVGRKHFIEDDSELPPCPRELAARLGVTVQAAAQRLKRERAVAGGPGGKGSSGIVNAFSTERGHPRASLQNWEA